MTYEEALKHFKNHEYMTDFSWQDEMSEIAITAIEKQIAKKPKKETVQVNGYDHGCDDYCYTEESCPSCNLSILRGVSYCTHCGQRLLWEDANEEISHRDQTRRG